ncbi:MAG: nicotinate-nucleotide--dimethylbenzimidazole phosphoribosyltransferase [Bacteroidota bacterium]
MDFIAQLQHKIDHKTKPLGALGTLERLALQIGEVQQTLTPELQQPTIVVFAGDHGIARAGVSAYPQEVTFQMVMNFLQGGAAINTFCKQHDITLAVVDAGVNYDFSGVDGLVHSKVRKGTRNFLKARAMTDAELENCLKKGAELVQAIQAKGCNIIGFGEMGIGNTSAASLLMSSLCKLPLEECIGRGTGVSDDQYQQKIATLTKARAFHGEVDNPKALLQTFGGFEMAQMYGAMLEAFRQNMLIMVDGFIATSVYLVAAHTQAAIQKNAIFCHLSDEAGHQKMLTHLKATPLLRLGMRLGEGTGCAVAYPIIKSAVTFLNEMASFKSAAVSNKSIENLQ